MPKSRKQRPSSTAGKVKSDNCHRSQLKNLHSKDPRLYRTNPALYAAAARVIYTVNAKKGSTHKSPWIEEIENQKGGK